MVFTDPSISGHYAIGTDIVITDPLARLHGTGLVGVAPDGSILDPTGAHGA